VKRAGGRVYVQLWHSGRVSHPDLTGGELPVRPLRLLPKGSSISQAAAFRIRFPRELDAAEIGAIVSDFQRAGEAALEAGFDGVELHGAFGYLPDQFLRDRANRRTDAYGGPGREPCALYAGRANGAR
jgi:N-ethylmaleimide reductase